MNINKNIIIITIGSIIKVIIKFIKILNIF